MRSGVIVTTLLTMAGVSQAQDRPAGPTRPYAVVRIDSAAAIPARKIEIPARAAGDREFRIHPGLQADRSAHSRALDEMNAINNRRPRSFRFRPVMALKFDAADLDAPAHMSGIAPALIGLEPRPR